MKLKSSIALLLAALFFSAGAVFAQDAPKAEEPKPLVDVSGVLFFDYSYLIESKEKVADVKKEGQDSMNLNRAYVSFAKKIDDVWSVKVTLDGGTNDGSDAFVKNAYGQMAQDFGAASLKVQFGVIGTPIIGLFDGINGSRWIYQNYIDKASDILGNTSGIDIASADTGIKADLNVMKIVSITGMYSNGDGYKTKEQDQNPVTKAYYGVLNITPTKELNIYGYYHWHDLGAKAEENYVSFYGGGAAWSDKAVRVGGAYTMAAGKAADVDEESTILEFWVNVNMEQFIGTPILLIGRYAMGTYEKKVAAAKLENEGSALWAGLGYQSNKNVQFAVMYKTEALEKKTAGTATSDFEASTVYVKSEVKF